MSCSLLIPWWRHQVETFSALLALCAGNSPVTREFPTQRPVTRNFNAFFDLCLNRRLSKQWLGWWFETQSRPLWRQCYATQQIGVHETLLCYIHVRTIVSSTKSTFVLMLNAWCVFYVFECALSVSFQITHMNIGSLGVYFEFTLLSSAWWTQNGFKSPIVNTKISWPHGSTNLLGRFPHGSSLRHDDVIKWKYFPRYWPLVWGIHRYWFKIRMEFLRPILAKIELICQQWGRVQGGKPASSGVAGEDG